jgi:hypothetical protein
LRCLRHFGLRNLCGRKGGSRVVKCSPTTITSLERPTATEPYLYAFGACSILPAPTGSSRPHVSYPSRPTRQRRISSPHREVRRGSERMGKRAEMPRRTKGNAPAETGCAEERKRDTGDSGNPKETNESTQKTQTREWRVGCKFSRRRVVRGKRNGGKWTATFYNRNWCYLIWLMTTCNERIQVNCTCYLRQSSCS